MKKKILALLVTLTLLCVACLTGCNGCSSITKAVDKNVYGGSGDTTVEIYIYTDEGRLVWATKCLRREYTLEAYQSSYVLTIRKNGETRHYIGGIIEIIEATNGTTIDN